MTWASTAEWTTRRAPFRELGRRAVETALALVRGETVPSVVSVPTELVVRRSCGCLPSATSYGSATSMQQEDLATQLRRALVYRPAELPPDWPEQLDVQPARVGTHLAVHLEVPEHLVDDPVEVAGLVPVGRLDRVAVHRVALPDHVVPGRGHLLHDRRQHVAYLMVAHPADQGEPAGDVVRVELLAQLQRELRRGGRA